MKSINQNPAIDVRIGSMLSSVLVGVFMILLIVVFVAAFVGGLVWFIFGITHKIPTDAISPDSGLLISGIVVFLLFYAYKTRPKIPNRIVVDRDTLYVTFPFYAFCHPGQVNLAKLVTVSRLILSPAYKGRPTVYGLRLEDASGNTAILELGSLAEKYRTLFHDPLYTAITKNHAEIGEGVKDTWSSWFSFMNDYGDRFGID